MDYPRKEKNDRINSRVHSYQCSWSWPYETRDIRLAELMAQGMVRQQKCQQTHKAKPKSFPFKKSGSLLYLGKDLVGSHMAHPLSQQSPPEKRNILSIHYETKSSKNYLGQVGLLPSPYPKETSYALFLVQQSSWNLLFYIGM